MNPAETVFKTGFAPAITTEGLIKLKAALEADDTRLLQGATTKPPPLMCVQDWPCEGACAVTLTGWPTEGDWTVGQAEEYFAQRCFDADNNLGEAAACRWFLNWFDDTPRDEMRREMLFWLETILAERTTKPTELPAFAA